MNSEKYVCLLDTEICSLMHAKKICSGFAVRQQANLSIKGMDFTAQRGSLQGFPFRAGKKKIIGKGNAGQPSEFQPLIKECLYFPRGESMEAVGKGSTLALKRGCLGTILFFRCEDEPA